MKYYKLTRVIGDRYYSSTAVQAEIEYIPGQWVHPEFGKLFVFDDYAAAINFKKAALTFNANLNLQLVLWTCGVKNPIHECEWMGDTWNKEKMRKFWEGETIIRLVAPKHTVYASSVKLIKMI